MSDRPYFFNPIISVLTLSALLSGCSDRQGQANAQTAGPSAASTTVSTPQGDFRSPITFSNPYAHIPAQCHIETSRGTQNACLFCHTNGVYQAGLGNNFPQAGAEPRLGNLQLEYSFTPISPFTASPSRNPWENTLNPEKLREAVAALGMVLAARLSAALGMAAEEDTVRLGRLLHALGLPTRIPAGLAPEALLARMRLDKKNLAGRLRLVLWRGIGRAEVVPDIDESRVLDLLHHA